MNRRDGFARRSHRPGEPAPKVGSWEEIGPEECPIMYRRTLFSSRRLKLLWHEFMPGASDEAAHDHPRSFVTFVLRGGYHDMTPCPTCADSAQQGWLLGPPSSDWRQAQAMTPCPTCDQLGWIVDRVYAPTVRFRPAEHAHITKVGPRGATTFVVMGPLRRDWGFFRRGRWYQWREFERLFGLSWRCPD